MTERRRPLTPLREFDYSLVAKKMDGLHINVNRDLERAIGEGTARGHHEHVRSLSVLIVMLRFAWNSYEAMRYVSADTPPDPARKANYAIVLPAINRQLLDLLFSLVYMLDDLIPRSREYQRAGWRDFVEERDSVKAEHGDNDDYAEFLEEMDSQVNRMVDRFKVTPEEQSNPNLVDYWKTPFKLAKRAGRCQPFLQFLESRIYRDVSAQAHLTFAGLIKVSGFLVADLMGDQVTDAARHRAMQSFHFQQVSRTAIIYLAVATEIDAYLRLNNQNAADYLWGLFSEFVVEAKEMWVVRYRDRTRYT